MLESIKKALELSEIREKLNALNAVTDPTDEQQKEERDLLANQKSAETEYREALQSEDDARTTPTAHDAETRERLQLVSRASLGAIFARAVEHRATEGAESELRAALHLAPNQVPIDLLRRARRGTGHHAGPYARRHKRATDPDANLRAW